jgi:hypothetical protein
VSLANHTTDQKTPHNGELSYQRSDDKNPNIHKDINNASRCKNTSLYISLHIIQTEILKLRIRVQSLSISFYAIFPHDRRRGLCWDF